MAALTSLPAELHLLILSQLSVAELLPVNAINRKLRSVTNDILSRRVQETSTREFGFQICPPPEKNIAPFHLCFNNGPSPLLPGADLPDVSTHLIPTVSHGIFGPPATKPPSENVRRTLVLEDNAFFTQLGIGLLLIKFGGANGSCVFRIFFDAWFRIRREDLRSAYRRQKPLVVWVDSGQNVGLHVRVLREEVEEGTETIRFEVEFVQVVVRGLWMAGRLESAMQRRYVGVL